MEVERPTHQAVTALLVHVETRTAGDNQIECLLARVVHALQRAFPSSGLVDLVEHDQGDRGRCRQPGHHRLGRFGPCATEGDIVPVVVGANFPLVQQHLAQRGLPALTWPRHHRHLVVRESQFSDGHCQAAFHG